MIAAYCFWPSASRTHPQLQRIEATGGLQRLRHQVRYAVFFIELGVQIGRLITHQLVMARVLQQEGAAADGLEELLAGSPG